MFTKGLVKTAATSLKNYITAVANREIKIDKALRTATKGKSREMHKRLRSVQDLQKRVNHPLSMDMLAKAKERGISPDASARVAKSRVMDRLGEHAKHFTRTTRKPLEAIREETRMMARRKKHYADSWKETSKELSAKIKKLKTRAPKKAVPAKASKKKG